jgi:hypothetical protein
MKKARVTSTSGVLQQNNVRRVYPLTTEKINTPTNKSGLNPTRLSDLMLAILRCRDIDCWLSIYDRLDEAELLAAHCLRDSYCQHHDLTHVSVLSSHGALEAAWLFGEAALEAASTCAALYAFYCVEGGGRK